MIMRTILNLEKNRKRIVKLTIIIVRFYILMCFRLKILEKIVWIAIITKLSRI